MILKEAFRTQNFYDSLIKLAEDFLYSNDVMKRTEEHNRKKSDPNAENEIIEVPKINNLVVNNVIDFLVDVFAEQKKLTYAIEEAKAKASINIDAEVGLNKKRQRIRAIFGCLAIKKPTETKTVGYGYKFNVNGDQIRYNYDIKQVSTIDYDRNKVKKLSNDFMDEANKISIAIDASNINLEVDYIPKYFIGDSFEDCLETYLAQ